MRFREAVAAHELGLILRQDLPSVAYQGMLEGLDSKSLAMLAGASPPPGASTAEFGQLLYSALRELGLPRPDRLQAAKIMRSHYACEVASGRIAPREGAGKIVRLLHDIDESLPKGKFVGESFGIARLVGLYHEFDDLPMTGGEELARELDRKIRGECEKLAGSE